VLKSSPSMSTEFMSANPYQAQFTEDELKVHRSPAWRDRADFILQMKIESRDPTPRFEQIWSRQLGGELFEVCCIPFFIYDLALGDHVRVRERDGRNLVDVVAAAGRHTFRAWFGNSPGAGRDEVAAELQRLGCLLEWHSRDLLAIDAANDEMALQAVALLENYEKQGHLQFETGRTGE